MNRTHLSPLVLALCAGLITLPAHAEDKPGANKALRRLQMELSQTKAAAEAEKAELSSKLEKAEADAKKGEAVQKQARALGGEVAQLRRALTEEKAHSEALQKQDEAHVQEARAALADTVGQANERFTRYEADITGLRQQLAEAQAKQHQTDAALQKLEAEKQQLASDLGERGESLASCVKKNGELFQLNADLRKRYEDKGLFSILRRGEPLTGLARVQEQNALQDIEDKAYDARIVAGSR